MTDECRADEAGPASSAQERTGPRWLSESEQWGWRALLRGHHLLMEALERELAESGLSMSEFEILAMLSEHPQARLRMSVLADLVVQSRSRLTHTVRRLETKGLVRRTPSRADGRGVEVQVCTPGRARLDEIAPVHVDGVRRYLIDLISQEELATLTAVMRRVIEATRTSQDQGADAFAPAPMEE